jgi:hypothetical protein
MAEGELTWGREFVSNRPNQSSGIINSIYMGKVVSVDDDYNVGRIRVFIGEIDEASTPDDSLPYAYPLMSRIVHVMPKVGEAVLVLMGSTFDNKKSQLRKNRFWIGPLISNYQNILNDNTDVFGMLNVKEGVTSTKNVTADPLQVKARNRKSDEINIFPVDDTTPPLKENNNLDNVTIIGRNNTDIIQSDNKVTTRAGKHLKNKPNKQNTINPTYSILEFIDENTSYGLTAGDEVYLVSHKGRYKFKKILTKDDIQELRDNAQSMLYGELTVQYLKVLTEVFLGHIHQHPEKEPTYSQNSKYRTEDLRKELQNIENLLAKNIKIN